MTPDQDPSLRNLPPLDEITQKRQTAGLKPSGLPIKNLDSLKAQYRETIVKMDELRAIEPKSEFP